MLGSTESLSSPCKNSLDTWAKVFCLHTSITKKLSNNFIIEQTVKENIKNYTNTVLSGVEVNHCQLAPSSNVL